MNYSLLKRLALCAVALLTTGVASAKTEEYDFATMVSSFGDTNEHYPTYDGKRIFNYNPGSWINIEKMSYTGFNLNDRFAAEARGSSCYNFRNANGSDWDGLNSGGDYARIFSILNLAVGDKVTIYYNQGNLYCYASTDYGTSGRGAVSGLNHEDAVTTETEYTVTTAGRFDMISGTSKVNIKKIVIKTSAKVSVTIDASAGGTTLVSTTPLDFTSSSVKAYYASAASSGEVTFSPVNKVAANTPIFVKGATGSYEIDELEGDADATTGNLLKGMAYATTYLQSTEDTKYYVFGVMSDEAGFYPVSTSDSFTSAAGKAYLQLTAAQASNARSIRFLFNNDDITGVNEVNMENDNKVSIKKSDLKGVYYTLYGQRVENPTKGIYIVNGKKVVID